ncbi:cas scaffolding protein family member 4 [Stegastes partitus]|uniref:Cas scaffold protein family member 4 n=1 Tax=Stegastes partitus TaxID=144197 RepID=A0A3B4ZBZ5_9TELE|nr:PREDICTED: cas scaffolding protein family member 4 [Stegastes partitus]
MNKLAKALYDNTAECPDELAFRKGDIVTVMHQNVAGTSGWWMCSLYGRHGLAPANRLKLLPQGGLTAGSLSHVTEKPKLTHAEAGEGVQNIYQIPSVPRPTSSPAYERMDLIYKVPSTPLSASKSPIPSALQHGAEGPDGNKLCFFNMASSPKREVYDVPSQARRASLFTEIPTPKQMSKKHSLIPISELEKRFDSLESIRCSSPGDSYVYAVPPPLPQDPNYDIPVPSSTESQQKSIGGYCTLPNPRKPEWIYDVPVGPEKLSPGQGSYDTMPSKAICRQLYDTLPAHALPVQRDSPTSSLYDIPKSSCLDIPSPPRVLPRVPLHNKPPPQSQTEELVYAVPPKEEPATQVVSDPPSDHKPLECRGAPKSIYELKNVRLKRMRNFLACTSFHELPGSVGSSVQEDEQAKASLLTSADSQRISTASSSSTSSCDSLALSSSSPEPLRELTLSQDEACRKLLGLQESVCKAVPQLMDFVSSHWRCKEHLEKHLKEIKEAAEGISCSLTCFLNFALDVKGNARRLTDTNLQTRLYKQLSIIEDSGVILQQTVSALNMAGWPLSSLCQDPGQIQTPDQLERFVMVARTIPEDVKRLVSIINANGKLLFRAPQKDPESGNTVSPSETKRSPEETEQGGDLEDDNDYVELQTKDEESEQKDGQKEAKENITPASNIAQAENKRHSSDSGSGTEEQRSSSLSEHCRLYFGALQKAIGGFVGSLQDGQPPEQFISQSKLVIMVGQRLVDTLCREAHRGGSSQSLLCKSNHLCALLKQLAVATKKAALHFPDKQSLYEAQEFAKELAQRAQHFRISLDL